MGGVVGGWALPRGPSAAPGSSRGVTPAGADLLKLTREDVIQICGPADGIRLFNALKGRWVAALNAVSVVGLGLLAQGVPLERAGRGVDLPVWQLGWQGS